MLHFSLFLDLQLWTLLGIINKKTCWEAWWGDREAIQNDVAINQERDDGSWELALNMIMDLFNLEPRELDNGLNKFEPKRGANHDYKVLKICLLRNIEV